MRYVINYTGQDTALRQELLQISDALENLNGWYIPIFYSAPENPQRGQLVYADATSWDPGSGTGVYSYDGTSWNKIGTAAGGGATQLGELSDVNNTVAKTNRNALIADGSLFQSRALVEADISDLGTYAPLSHTHSQYLTDAPSDGKQYARRDANWSEIVQTETDEAYSFFMVD
jgi:hypothetical protein